MACARASIIHVWETCQSLGDLALQKGVLEGSSVRRPIIKSSRYSGCSPKTTRCLTSWRDNRLESGWRSKDSNQCKASAASGSDTGKGEELEASEVRLGRNRFDLGLDPGLSQAPTKLVKAVPRFLPNLMAPRALMSGTTPPLKRVRGPKVATAIYSFVDASGQGFGSTSLSKLLKQIA
jgi:hypothetical protein